MTIRHRRIFFFCCILLFFVAAAGVLFFAGEYTFDQRAWSFVRKGLVLVKTEPKADRVSVDDRVASFQSNEWRLQVAPGTYSVRVEKEGYWPWEETLDVAAGKASRLDTIRLLPRHDPYVIQRNIKGVAANGAGEHVLLWNEAGKLILWTPESGGRFLDRVQGNVTAAGWAKNGRRFFVSTETDIFLGDLQSQQLQPLTGPWQSPRVQFAGDTDDSFYVVSGNQLFSVTDSGVQNPLLLNSTEEQQLSTATLLPSPPRYITLLDTTRSVLSIVDTDGNLVEQFTNVLYAAWSPDGKRLAFGNTVELYLTDETFEPTLLERTSEGLTSAAWVAGRNALVFADTQGVNILDDVQGTYMKKYPIAQNAAGAILSSNNALVLLDDKGTLTAMPLDV